jgi:signal transduction histidine kinase
MNAMTASHSKEHLGSDRNPDSSLGLGETFSTNELEDIVGTFTAVTERLQNAHVTLQAEVTRLQKELRDKNEQLRRSQQLAALGRMAAGIAHEIRNPLGSIRLYAEMLTEDLDRQDGPLINVRKIQLAVSDLDSIVGDVLAFSREIQVRSGPVDPADLVTSAIESCQGLLHESDVELIRDDLNPPWNPGEVYVEADPLLINQVLGNVIRNAVEAMDGKGPLRFSLGLTREQPDDDEGADAPELAEDDEDGAESEEGRILVAICVTDAGPGIPETQLAQVFTPFFTTRATGTGLGLAIAHRIIDAHGGSIGIRNETQGGLTARVGLPPFIPSETPGDTSRFVDSKDVRPDRRPEIRKDSPPLPVIVNRSTSE